MVTYRASNIKPYYYFQDLFTELPKFGDDKELSNLMPWNLDLGEE